VEWHSLLKYNVHAVPAYTQCPPTTCQHLPIYAYPLMPNHDAYPLMPNNNTYPLMPTHNTYPLMPTHNTYPLMPTHLCLPSYAYPLMPTLLCLPTYAYPLMPSHNTYLLMPNHNTYPLMPTHNTYQLMPTHLYLPMLMPTHAIGASCGDSLLNTVVTANTRAKGLTSNNEGTWITRVTVDHEEGWT
jgi:hypothetical protein